MNQVLASNKLENIPIEIWPSIREVHDRIFNVGSPRAELAQRYPTLNFSGCPEVWEYDKFSEEATMRRAEQVLDDLRQRQEEHILLVSHQVFISYLVGRYERFGNAGKESTTLYSPCLIS